jgi:hypothetical protein
MNVLADPGRRLVSEPVDPELRETYTKLRFLQFENFVDGDALAGIIADLLPQVRPYAVRLVKPHEVSEGLLREGRRFDRIDAGPFKGELEAEADKQAVRDAFDRSGLTGFVAELLTSVQPFVEDVVGQKLEYDRTFLLSYGEGDFIAPHGDTQTSRRIMVQMPIAFGCRTAMRVMRDGWMEPYYDNPGSLRIHGPGIWHEVLPVLRLDDAVTPERVLVTARLPFADAA